MKLRRFQVVALCVLIVLSGCAQISVKSNDNKTQITIPNNVKIPNNTTDTAYSVLNHSATLGEDAIYSLISFTQSRINISSIVASNNASHVGPPPERPTVSETQPVNISRGLGVPESKVPVRPSGDNNSSLISASGIQKGNLSISVSVNGTTATVQYISTVQYQDETGLVKETRMGVKITGENMEHPIILEYRYRLTTGGDVTVNGPYESGGG